MQTTVVPMREAPQPAPAPAQASTPAPVRASTATARAPQHPPAPARGAFWPLLPLALAVVAGFAYQAWALDQERRQLGLALGGQDAGLAQAASLRRTLDSLATDTQRLADAGNTNARALVGDLRRRGVTIQVPGAAPAAGAGPASGR